MKTKKPKIKPSADTEISMWNAGYKVGAEKERKRILKIIGKMGLELKRDATKDGWFKDDYYIGYEDGLYIVKQKIRENKYE